MQTEEEIKELKRGRDMIRAMPLNIPFCEEDLEEIYSQRDKI